MENYDVNQPESFDLAYVYGTIVGNLKRIVLKPYF